ncbi:ankyrin and het domain protein [Colletotrichum plurivorum]|uniref:Ankyrin and het domain protein n=1 Tax=Colletotrichum plurivorum TaxID=2175906 RepID=A0A8H6JP65_9PEZI|nr:ankyrin and het domain protein [Colletotrichum plurivorum]
MPDYEYLPLGSNEIRRLILFPGDVEGPLQARVVHDIFEPPHTVPQYEALSYVWGSQETPETLTVFGDTTYDGSLDRSSLRDAGSIPLGQNLATALRHLRRKAETRVIWCDAACINQRDVEERSVQVQRMKDIYPASERVVAWLDPGGKETRRAMQIISQTKWDADFDFTTKTWTVDEDARKAPHYSQSLSRQDWQSLSHFLGLPWFKRLWVRQEIALANDSSIFMTGTDVVDLKTFSKAAHSIYRETWMGRVLMEEDVYSRFLLNLPNSALFKTDDGRFGLGTEAACEGDEIFVIPGNCHALILRPVGDSGYYKIVGPCFMSSLMWSEAAWGPLPEGWKVKMISGDPARVYEYTDPDGRTTRQDPRRGPLPPGWHETTHSDGTLAWYKLEDKETEYSWDRTDPRLTPDNLRARGVKVERLILV